MRAALGLALVLAAPAAGPAPPPGPPAPPAQIGAFYAALAGDWIGTVEQYTGGVKADTKYFHALITRTKPDTYLGTFQYYRLDTRTRAPIQIGTAVMLSTLAPDGAARSLVNGDGDVFIDPKTSKHEEHQLDEVLRMPGPGRLQGAGGGRIEVSGIALDAGRSGRVSDYTSAWTLDGGVLSISERLKVTFKVLFFSRHYDLIYNFTGRRGSDVAGLMKAAGAAPAR